MKTVFVVNPKAGQGQDAKKLIKDIRETARNLNTEVEIYETTAVGDATVFVRQYCEKNGGARFIACGGDGTLSEVLNGAIYCKESEVGVLPIGTGNDFCRNFSSQSDFGDIASQINGKSEKCDAIKYEAISGGVKKEGYSINMFNIGFDCNVADLTVEMKKKPFISGSLAYFISILTTLIKKKGANLKIELDGMLKHEGPLLLTSIANGKYCGGGIKSNPLASVQDGLINVNIIKNVSRLKFIYLLPFYMKGTFLKLKDIERIISSTKCRTVSITSLAGDLKICNDGEIDSAEKVQFEIIPGAFKFVLPTGKVFSKKVLTK